MSGVSEALQKELVALLRKEAPVAVGNGCRVYHVLPRDFELLKGVQDCLPVVELVLLTEIEQLHVDFAFSYFVQHKMRMPPIDVLHHFDKGLTMHLDHLLSLLLGTEEHPVRRDCVGGFSCFLAFVFSFFLDESLFPNS